MRRPQPLTTGGLALVLALALAGCSHSTAPIVKAPRLPVGAPGNSAPDSTVMRWIAAYTATVESEYDSLLTSDFHYHFSAQSDPTLVTQYGNHWGKVDETTSYHHLLHGFTNTSGTYVPPAIDLTGALNGVYVVADTAHADSAAWYKGVQVVQLLLTIDVGGSGGSTTYNVNSDYSFLLVRGDAAVLSAGQDHGATRWYIRQCDDFTTAYFARRKGPGTEVPLPAAPNSWGRVRAQYH